MLINLIRTRTRELSQEDFERMKPWFVYYESGWAILRTWHRGLEDLLGILDNMNGIELREGVLKINIAGTSGTLKKAFHRFVPEVVRERSHYRQHRD